MVAMTRPVLKEPDESFKTREQVYFGTLTPYKNSMAEPMTLILPTKDPLMQRRPAFMK
jgi:hypothetical protein